MRKSTYWTNKRRKQRAILDGWRRHVGRIKKIHMFQSRRPVDLADHLDSVTNNGTG